MGEIISKAELARRFAVDRAQPTRWENLGMPVRPDGRVDATAATTWVHRNVDATSRHYRKAREGRRTAADVDRQTRANAADEIGRLGLWLLAWRVPEMVAGAPLRVGVPLEQAKALYDDLLNNLPDLANETALGWMGLQPGEAGPFTRMDGLTAPDWESLAATRSSEV